MNFQHPLINAKTTPINEGRVLLELIRIVLLVNNEAKVKAVGARTNETKESFKLILIFFRLKGENLSPRKK